MSAELHPIQLMVEVRTLAVPTLVAGELSSVEKEVYEILGIKTKTIHVSGTRVVYTAAGSAEGIAATEKQLAGAEAKIVDEMVGIAENVSAPELTVPYLQPQISAVRSAVYEAFHINIVDFLTGSTPTVATALVDHMGLAKAWARAKNLPAGTIPSKKFELKHVSFQDFYKDAVPPVARVLAKLCGAKFVGVVGKDGTYWISRVGASLEFTVNRLGLDD